jgi:hypothetical protein
MSELSDRNFGILIAYVLPGFIALWGVSCLSPTVESWISTSQQASPSVAGFCYVSLASLAAGLSVSAVRWALLDTLHHATGIAPPDWRFAALNDKLPGFLALVENHYRYYQFYAGMYVAVAFSFVTHEIVEDGRLFDGPWLSVAVIAIELVFFTASRDSLRKYYHRVGSLLGTLPLDERTTRMTNGFHHKPDATEKAVAKKRQPARAKAKGKKQIAAKAR